MKHPFMRLLAITAITTVLSVVSTVGLAQSGSGLPNAMFKDLTVNMTVPGYLKQMGNAIVDYSVSGPGMFDVTHTLSSPGTSAEFVPSSGASSTIHLDATM